jgi:hypothetical protein|tara:strand:- start:851 stop:1042 length:192 start_codon:yes stop_codon:yes gene_type:complete
MKIGDLVEYSGRQRESNGRNRGIIVSKDTYHGCVNAETVIEVLWNTDLSWILQSRVRLIDEVR